MTQLLKLLLTTEVLSSNRINYSVHEHTAPANSFETTRIVIKRGLDCPILKDQLTPNLTYHKHKKHPKNIPQTLCSFVSKGSVKNVLNVSADHAML